MRIKINTRIVIVVMAVVVGLVGILPFVSLPAGAATQAELDDINGKLEEVKKLIKSYESEGKRLAGQANTLVNKIAMLKNDEMKLVAEIEMNQALHDEKVIEIETTEKRIADNSDMIGYIVAQFYYSEEVSTLERLASADNLASFIDGEARMGSLTDTLSGVVNENKALREMQVQQKEEVERILADLAAKREQLQASRAEQQRLLDATRGEEQRYQALSTEAKAEKERLEAEQQRINQEICARGGCSGITAGDPNKGGYMYSGSCPWAKWNGTQYGDMWGMFVCECVSYTAYKVDSNYGNMPYWGGHGNANQWLRNARNAGVPTGTVPKVGSVGVKNSGPYGHVVWVEKVAGNSIYISQYNSANAATNWKSGEYSEMWVSAGAYDGYIYFGDW